MTASDTPSRDRWSNADAYEAFMGRWSRALAKAALEWLALPQGRDWVDVGCGTGALTEAILGHAQPARIHAVEPAEAYLAEARRRITDARAVFHQAGAESLPLPEAEVDVAVAGLVLNFVPQPERAVREMRRVLRPGGTLAAYVWDYAEGMEMLRLFWDAAVALHPEAAALDEGRRFPLCRPSALRELLTGEGLDEVQVDGLMLPLAFRDFEDYWTPFLGGQGPAPSFATALPASERGMLRERIRDHVRPDAQGRVRLQARAWIARARAP